MKITEFRKTLIISASTMSFLASFLLSPATPAYATGSYSLTKSYTVSNSAEGSIARLNGKIYGFKDSSNLYVFDEASDTVTGTVSVTTNPYRVLVAAGDKIMGVQSNGDLYYFYPGSAVQSTFSHPCGNSWTSANGFTANENFLLVTCYTNQTVYLYDVSTLNTPTELANAKLPWRPVKAAIANGYAYVGDLTSASNVRKFSLATLNSAPYTTEAETTTVFSTTSINANLDISTNPLNLRIVSDGTSVWTISASAAASFKVSRINTSLNTASTTTLTDFISGSNPRYALGDIASDGTTLFISFGGNVSVVAFDVATSTPSVLVTPSQTSLTGILPISNGFWLSGPTGLLRYSLPVSSNPNVSDEARRKRQAEIDAARNALVQKIKAGDTVVNPDLIAADVQEFNAEIAKKANADFQIAAKAKDFGFSSVRTVITKWGIYQDIENGIRSTVTGRTASAAGIIPAGVVQKQLLISRVQKVAPDKRATVEQIDKLIADLAKVDADRKAKLAAVVKRHS